ncbi:U32 family peptidase [Mollicutes bacterium LVI A0039]|nr:U32 family peptidase [Mollicutes bacterium LVI A0039]
MKRPELLAPAGNLEKLKIACIYGADAVFLGGQSYGLRSNSDNFTLDDIIEGVKFANRYNTSVYVTTNIYAHSENLIGFEEYVIALQAAGVRGIIVSDPAYIEITKKSAPGLEIHISTQQSITNKYAVNYYEKQGVDRVVLARELTFAEIKEITDNCETEVEVFIHGAVCSSYSGRCTLSNHMTLRDSNRGGCCQSCRWDYQLSTKVDGQLVPNALNHDYNFTMSAKDMSMLAFIPQMCSLGVDSFKIEGRMKSFHYLATVVNVYRTALDSYFEDPENYQVKEEWINELKKAESRETYEGALIGDLGSKGQIFDDQYKPKQVEYAGYVLDYDQTSGYALVEERNHFKVGDTLEFFGPHSQVFKQVITEIIDDEGNRIERANKPLMQVKLKVDRPVAKHWLVRKG